MTVAPENEGISLRHGMTEDELKILRRLLGGTIGGVIQAVMSHPLDTIKSRVQHGMFPNIATCVRSTWKNEGAYGFYRGVTPPLILGGLYNSILFSLNQFMNNLMVPIGHDPNKPLPLWRTAVAAQLTAPLYVLALTPMEKVKVVLQIQVKGGVEASVTGPLSCIRMIVQRYGMRGLLSGYVPTVLARLIGLPFYFMSYQISKEYLLRSRLGSTQTGRELLAPMLSGVVAGVCFWTSNYPCDYVKTHLQASRTKVSITQVVRRTFEQSGFKGFYKGFSACIVRSAPANASVWLGVELTTKLMTNNGW